jgi:hypothetical protein
MSLNKSKLDQFVKRGGYEIIKQIKRGKRKGQFKNISEAARRTGLTRPTIYKILEEHPTKPSKVKPKYVETLTDSEGYRRLEQLYSKSISHNAWTNTIYTVQLAFKILGYSKDPISWTEEDYRQLWAAPEFHKEECKGIGKMYAIALRRLMRATDNHNMLAKFKFSNPPEGKKKQWFLHTDDIKQLVPVIDNTEVLLKVLVGITTGARDSGLDSITLERCDFSSNCIEVYEKKVRHYVLKFPPFQVMQLLKQYVTDMGFKPSDKIFPTGYSTFNAQLKKLGKKAGITKKVTTHILKHTFVSQAHMHGVSGSTIANQTGTEHRCLVKFYRAESEGLLRSEMQGIKFNVKPFHIWAAQIALDFKARYAQLRGSA